MIPRYSSFEPTLEVIRVLTPTPVIPVFDMSSSTKSGNRSDIFLQSSSPILKDPDKYKTSSRRGYPIPNSDLKEFSSKTILLRRKTLSVAELFAKRKEIVSKVRDTQPSRFKKTRFVRFSKRATVALMP